MIEKNILISPEMSLFDALEQMDRTERKLLVVCDDDMEFYGVISIGDIQRAVLAKIDLASHVSSFIRENIIYARQDEKIEHIAKFMKKERIESMPITSYDGKLVDVIYWNDIMEENFDVPRKAISFPVVIMAGGVGSRLRPLTNVIPKPLVPISSKTILEEIMDRFKMAGCEAFYLSINYKAQIIKDYFKNHKNNYKINYIEEKKPLGTAGSLYLLKDEFRSTFFVMNCDVLVDLKLDELVEYHRSNKNIVTVVSVLKNYNIPYGTLNTKEDGVLIGINEKPNYMYQINSGLYLLEPEVFAYINNGEYVHLPDVIERVVENGGRVGAFPIPEGKWVDMGNWEEYIKLIKRFELG